MNVVPPQEKDRSRPKEAYDEDSPNAGKQGAKQQQDSTISYDPNNKESMRKALDKMILQMRTVREKMGAGGPRENREKNESSS